MRRPVPLELVRVLQGLRRVPLVPPAHPVAVRPVRQALPPVRPVAAPLGALLSHSLPPSKP
jgi:hypothetical protein